MDHAKKMGHIHAEFHISNIDLNPETLFFLLLSYPSIKIHSAELRYEDDSLVPRLQTFLAAQQGKTVDELLQEISEQIDKDIAKEENKFNKNALKALKKFVNDPDEIKITVSPTEPVPLGKLQGVNPVKVPEVLNIKIKT